MNRNYKAVLFGYGTMGERHRNFFEKSGVQFVKIFDLEDLDGAGNIKSSLVEEFVSNEKIDFAVVAFQNNTLNSIRLLSVVTCRLRVGGLPGSVFLCRLWKSAAIISKNRPGSRLCLNCHASDYGLITAALLISEEFFQFFVREESFF